MPLTLDSLFKECEDFINKEHPNFGNEETLLSTGSIDKQYLKMIDEWKKIIFKSEYLRAVMLSKIKNVRIQMRHSKKSRF